MFGVRYGDPLAIACDVLFAIEAEGVPMKDIREWRQRADQRAQKSQVPDRETWGLQPGQIAKTSRLTGGAGMKPPRGGIGTRPPKGGLSKG